MSSPLLAIEDLSIELAVDGASKRIVENVAFDIELGETVGLVGESGTGKTLTALAILGLVPPPARVAGRIELAGRNLLDLDEEQLRALRGRRIGAVFQEPAIALNPVLTVGQQIVESLTRHRLMGRREARREASRILDLVALPGGSRRLDDYPHQLSGGQRQRVMIATALAGRPDLLIADEPTTALDVTVQAQILRLLEELREALDLSVLLISHDLGVVAQCCDRIVVMDGGRVVECAPSGDLFDRPVHPATRRMLAAVGSEPSSSETDDTVQRVRSEPAEPLVRIRDLAKRYTVRDSLQRPVAEVRAIDGVDLEIQAGECVAVVGESGCGKTSLAHCLLRLTEASDGEIIFAGTDLRTESTASLRRRRSEFQIVFQDPGSSLNPRLRVGRSIAEPLEIHTALDASGRRQRVTELLRLVELTPEIGERWPHELSTGQKQRIGIARALAAGPRLLVADEPLSALDIGIRTAILDLLDRLRRELDLAILLVSHDLGVVRRVADRVAVMYCGRIVETAPTRQLFAAPRHPYTVSLLSALPVPDPSARPRWQAMVGEPPDPADPPPGCHFHPRCPIAEDRCRREEPELIDSATGDHRVACHLPGELRLEYRQLPDDGTF